MVAHGFQQAIESNVGFALAVFTTVLIVPVQQKPNFRNFSFKLYPQHRGSFFVLDQMSTLVRDQEQTARHRPGATVSF